VATSEAGGFVQNDNVHVATECAVLEAVVEERHRGASVAGLASQR
jgi:hypothetical protein